MLLLQKMSTVNEVLKQIHNIMESLQLDKIFCVFDQAVYAKAAEIVWKHDKFKNIIIGLGLFHIICNLLSIFGKRFQDAGLRDLCAEYGVIAEGFVAGVMDGRNYNHAIRLHKFVYEALMRLAWKDFLPWLKFKHAGEVHHFNKAMKSIASLQNGVSQVVFQELLECELAAVSNLPALHQK